MRRLFVALHESGFGPSRHIAEPRDLGRFEGIAEVDGQPLTVPRYTTSGFLRIKLGEALQRRGVAPHIFESAKEAQSDWRDAEGLADSATERAAGMVRAAGLGA